MRSQTHGCHRTRLHSMICPSTQLLFAVLERSYRSQPNQIDGHVLSLNLGYGH